MIMWYIVFIRGQDNSLLSALLDNMRDPCSTQRKRDGLSNISFPMKNLNASSQNKIFHKLPGLEAGKTWGH